MKILYKFIFCCLFTLSLYGQDVSFQKGAANETYATPRLVENSNPHLILYFDMNKTLIASDQKQGITNENSLNKSLASKWKYCWDETIEDPISYADYVKQVLVPGQRNDPEVDKKRQAYYFHFVTHLQEKGHPLYEKISAIYHQALERLQHSPGTVFPSFYRLLDKLDEEKRSYTVILRSFGSEVFEVAKTINSSYKPLFEYYGNFKEGAPSINEQHYGSDLSEVYRTLHSLSHIAIRDDYNYWDQNECRTPFGKLFPVDFDNENILEIFFDDNIKLQTGETNIIAPMDVQTEQIIPVEKLAQSGQIVRVNTLEAILDDNYFVKHVQHALLKANKQQPYYVGELGQAWEFPSDHLPIGLSVDGLHIACWNILNKDYAGFIEMNTQGLKDSSILRDNVPVNANESLTVREKFIGDSLLGMIHHPTHPRSLIALQETNQDVVEFLKAHLPPSWKILITEVEPEDIFLYDSDIFELINTQVVPYSLNVSNIIFTANLKEKSTGKSYRFIQSHVPGGPLKSVPACAEFAEEVLKQYEPDLTIILMGDMNQAPFVIGEALRQAAIKMNRAQPYSSVLLKNPTHVNTHWEASWFDNFFAASPQGHDPVKVSQGAEEFFPALGPIIDLFSQLQQK